MLFERFETKGLAHYSYVVGCPGSKEVAVIDPRRDIDVYLDFGSRKGLRITEVLETHIHADYASGARELAERTGATFRASGHDRGEDYEISFAHTDIHDGDAVELGRVRIQALHTPGHTPEHLSFLVYDLARSSEVPEILLSGDFLFVGSLGRPDLLGEEAKRRLAAAMHESVQERINELPDGLEVHPAHGAGSMCGSGMSGRPSSTLGFERMTNPYLDPHLDREEFIERLLGSVPPFPPYYRRMKAVNSEGPPILAGLPGGRAIPVHEFRELVDAGHVVVDLRDQLAYGGGHVPGSLGIGAGSDLAVWAAWVVPYDRPILLVPAEPAQAEEAARALVRVGLDDVRGYLQGGIEGWVRAGFPLAETPQLSPSELHERLSKGDPIRVVDVRTAEEWAAGHVEGAHHIMGGGLAARLDELEPEGRPIATICASGYRSTVAASVLERAGFRDVLNVTGGMGAWERAELPTVRD